MSRKVESLSKDELKALLAKRLKQAKKYREQTVERQWSRNEQAVFFTNGRAPQASMTQWDNGLASALMSEGSETEQGENSTEMAVNYAFKFLRFIHAQMSANPPSVLVKPATTDPSDRAAADAGDRAWRHGYAKHEIPEVVDQTTLKVGVYGTGWVAQKWNADAGEGWEMDDESGELTMLGDHDVYSPSVWDMWVDPDAKSWRKARFTFERLEYCPDEAHFLWPEAKDVLNQATKNKAVATVGSALETWKEPEDTIEIFYYEEKAAPINGMAGRMAYCLEDGTILGTPTENTNESGGSSYALMTDIDVPDQVYGKSFIDYVHTLQDLLNRLDTAMVDAVAAHGVVRMILPENAEIEDESLSNSAWDYVKITGNAGVAPYFVPAPQLMPDMHTLRANLVAAIADMAGMNDALQGKTSREVSGFSLQTMIEAGNQTRRRLFNKYTLMVRDIAKQYLGLARLNWDDKRAIRVLGKERAFESVELSGADIASGFDLVCEYGASLSLDPARRREEIMQLMPVFEKAGIPAKTVLGFLKLNELEQLYDRAEIARLRQEEEVQQIIATGKQVEVREMQDHAGRLDYLYYFLETSAFKYLPEEVKALIEENAKLREQKAAEAATKGQEAPPAAGGMPAPGGDPMAAMMGAAGAPPAPVSPQVA